MDMDYGGPAGLARLAEDVADGLVPPPHLVVQTSHGFVGQGDRRQYHQKCHLLWAAADAADNPAGFTLDAAEDLIQQLGPRYGADPAVRSGEHLLRVPGFFNCKAQARAQLYRWRRSYPCLGSRAAWRESRCRWSRSLSLASQFRVRQ